MRVLVTGAAGFLGRHLVTRLAARGDEAVAFDLAPLAELPAGVHALSGSVTDADAVARAAEGCEGVIHAAALTGLWQRDPADFERVNTGGTRTVLAAASAAGARQAVLVSSFTTLIAGPRRRETRDIDEETELPAEAMLGPYPRSKRLAELHALEAPLRPAIVLPTAPIGPGDATPTPPGALLRDLAEGRIPIMPDGTWNLVDIRALADGVIAALDRGVPGRRYLMGGENMDTGGLLERFAAVTGLRVPGTGLPHGVALTAARVEGLASRITGRAPRAPLTGVRLSAPRLRFLSTRAETELSLAPMPAATAMRDALRWMRDEGMISRPMPDLEGAPRAD